MAIPILIFVVCFGVGAVLSGHVLPDLAAGSVGGLAFFVVCGLLAAALGVVGLHVYLTIDLVTQPGGGGPGLHDFNAETVASGLENILRDAGILVGLAVGVYLLAPPPEEDGEPVASAAPQS